MQQPGKRKSKLDNAFLGGGEMGALMRTIGWANTLPGPAESWPQSLQTAVSVCLIFKIPDPDLVGPKLNKFETF